MSFTSRKKKDLKSCYKNDFKDAYVIRIATEGTVTEPGYFQSDLMGKRCSRIRVEVLKTTGGYSAPRQVFERLIQSVRKDGAQEADQYWIVVDVDHHATNNGMDTFIDSVEAFNSGNNMNFQLAISNPRFEVWLALHRHLDLKSKKIIQKLSSTPEELVKEIDPHYKKLFDLKTVTREAVQIAIYQAMELDSNKGAKQPNSPGTRVHRLVGEIQKILDQ